MFLKQTSYKPRTLSQSSGTAEATSPAESTSDSGQGAANSPTNTARRRSSATERFASLQQHKRQADQVNSDKKASWADQKPGNPGILGSMWSSFTKGS